MYSYNVYNYVESLAPISKRMTINMPLLSMQCGQYIKGLHTYTYTTDNAKRVTPWLNVNAHEIKLNQYDLDEPQLGERRRRRRWQNANWRLTQFHWRRRRWLLKAQQFAHGNCHLHGAFALEHVGRTTDEILQNANGFWLCAIPLCLVCNKKKN